MLSVISLIAGLVFLVKGADLLVSGGSSVAKRFNVPNIVIGLTIVAFGTSAPEFVVSALAAYSGEADLSLSNIVGSVVTNTLLGLGLAGVIQPFKLKQGTVWKEIPFSVLAVIVVLLLANDQWIANGGSPQLSWSDGLVLLAFFAIFMYYTFGISRTKSSNGGEVEDVKDLGTGRSVTYILIGLVGLAVGGDWIVSSATTIAQIIGVSDNFVGLLIVGPGTSLPEIATVVIAARKHQVDLAVGGIVGSNIFNIFLIIGTSAVIGNLAYDPALNVDIALILATSLLLFFALFVGKKHVLQRWQAVTLLLYYVAYVVYLFIRG